MSVSPFGLNQRAKTETSLYIIYPGVRSSAWMCSPVLFQVTCKNISLVANTLKHSYSPIETLESLESSKPNWYFKGNLYFTSLVLNLGIWFLLFKVREALHKDIKNPSSVVAVL